MHYCTEIQTGIFPYQGYMFLLSALSAESKKETNPLRPLRLCGDYIIRYRIEEYVYLVNETATPGNALSSCLSTVIKGAFRSFAAAMNSQS